MRRTNRLMRLIVAGSFLAIALTAPVASAADPQTNQADRAVALAGRLSGSLPPAPVGAGRFAYYRIEYPGDDRVVTINMQAFPDDPDVLDHAGFFVYGPRKDYVYAHAGPQPKLTPNLSGNLISKEKGTYLIQVYNDHPTATLAYTIWADGLPAALVPAAPPSAATGPATAPATAPAASPPSVVAPAAGSVNPRAVVIAPSVLGPGWTIKSESDRGSNDVIKLYTVEFQNEAASMGALAAVAVASNDAVRDALLPEFRRQFEAQGYTVAPNSEFGDRPGLRGTLNKAPAAAVLRVFAVKSAVVTILVVGPSTGDAAALAALSNTMAAAQQSALANASGAQPTAPGASTAPASTGGGTGTLSSDPARPTRLTAERQGGSLSGGQKGNFAFYAFDYLGDNSTVSINVQVYPDDPALLEHVGFIVYGPVRGKEYVVGDIQPKLVPNVAGDISNRERGTYVVQVYNYDPQGRQIDFQIWATGLK